MDQTRGAGGIEVIEESRRTVVRMWGEVDASLREQASMAMVQILKRPAPTVVGMADLTFVDSSGIAFLVQLHRISLDESTELTLLDPPALVTDLLDMIGLGDALVIERTEARDAAPA